MSVKDILQHSIDKNPLAMKEALAEELETRIQTAIEEMMAAEEVELDEETEELEEAEEMEDEDEDESDDEEDEEDED